MHVGSFQKNSHNSRGIRLWDFVLWSVCFTWLLNYSFNLVCCCFASCQLCVYFRVLSLQSGPCTFLVLVFSRLVFHCFIVLVYYVLSVIHSIIYADFTSGYGLYLVPSVCCSVPFLSSPSNFLHVFMFSWFCNCQSLPVLLWQLFVPCVLHLAFLPLL